MKVLVAFYSRDGHTRAAAEMIAEALGADVDGIADGRPRRGIMGFLRAGYDATRGRTTEIRFSKDPASYDLVVVGTPVWNGRVTPAVRTYLERNSGRIRRAAFFATCAGRPGRCIGQMKEIYGGRSLAERVILRDRIEEGAEEFVRELRELLASTFHEIKDGD